MDPKVGIVVCGTLLAITWAAAASFQSEPVARALGLPLNDRVAKTFAPIPVISVPPAMWVKTEKDRVVVEAVLPLGKAESELLRHASEKYGQDQFVDLVAARADVQDLPWIDKIGEALPDRVTMHRGSTIELDGPKLTIGAIFARQVDRDYYMEKVNEAFANTGVEIIDKTVIQPRGETQ